MLRYELVCDRRASANRIYTYPYLLLSIGYVRVMFQLAASHVHELCFLISMNGRDAGGGKMPKQKNVDCIRSPICKNIWIFWLSRILPHLLLCMEQGNIENAQDSSSESAVQDAPIKDLFLSKEITNFSREDIERLAKSITQRETSWIVVLYAPWCPYCQVSLKTFLSLSKPSYTCKFAMPELSYKFFLGIPHSYLHASS